MRYSRVAAAWRQSQRQFDRNLRIRYRSVSNHSSATFNALAMSAKPLNVRTQGLCRARWNIDQRRLLVTCGCHHPCSLASSS